MKKLLIGLPVVAAVVFAGVPFMTGIVAEKKSKELVDVVNTQTSQYGTVEITKYDRGLMSSDSSYKFSLAPTIQKATKLEHIEYDCQVNHGITGVKYACLMSKKGAYQAFLDEFLGGKDPLSMTGNISAFGSIDQTLAVAPLSADLPEGPKVIISEEIALTTVFDQSASAYDFTGKIPNVLVEKDGSLNVDDITFDGNVKELRDGLYVGDVTLMGNQIKAVDDKGSLLLTDFNVDTSTKESNSKVTSTMAMNVKTLEFPNQRGEIDTFTDVVLDLGMYGMGTDALVNYIKANEEMQKALLAAGDDDSAQGNAAMASMTQLIPVVEELMKPGLGLNMKSSFMTGGTKNDVTFDLSLTNEMKFNQMMGFLFSPDDTLKNFKGNLKLSLKKELLEKYPPLALTLGSIPFFVQTDSGVTLDVSLDSVLKVNGEETTIAELQSLFR